jgi:hypothetical protein
MSDQDNEHEYEGIWSFIVLICIILICGAIISYNILVNATPGKAIGGSIAAIIVFVLIWVLGLVGGARYWPNAENSCHENPCLHDGKCNNEYWDGYNCTCTEDWKGTNCSEASDKAINKRPCKQDPYPCYHDAKCTDTDENEDGIFENYECGTDGKCPKIEGDYDKDIRWVGKDCNDFPDDFEGKYVAKCFKEIDGKTDDEKRPWVKCGDPVKCMHYQDMNTNCMEECNLDTNIWCEDTDFIDPCIGKTDFSKLDTCKSYNEMMTLQAIEIEEEEDKLHINNLIRECNNDLSTNWINGNCKCISSFNCNGISDMSKCRNTHCCKVNGSNCVEEHQGGYVFSDHEMNSFYHRGGRNKGGRNKGGRNKGGLPYRNR